MNCEKSLKCKFILINIRIYLFFFCIIFLFLYITHIVTSNVNDRILHFVNFIGQESLIE